MIGSTVLHVLARAADARDDLEIQRALGAVDPLVRALALRRARRALDQAARSVASQDDRAHVLRVAFLIARKGLPEASFDDAPAIAAEYEAARAGVSGGLPRRRWATPSLAAVLIVV